MSDVTEPDWVRGYLPAIRRAETTRTPRSAVSNDELRRRLFAARDVTGEGFNDLTGREPDQPASP